MAGSPPAIQRQPKPTRASGIRGKETKMTGERRHAMTPAELAAIRDRLGCTGEAFAAALGYRSHTDICKFEHGHRAVPDAAARLAVMLDRHGIPVAKWFDGDTLTRLIAMFRHYGVPTARSFDGGGDVHASR
jgi:DNA-binding transcriptional regulator YiaG